MTIIFILFCAILFFDFSLKNSLPNVQMLRARFDSIQATIGFDASLGEIRVALLFLALIDKGNAIKIKLTILYQVYAGKFLPRVTFNRREASLKEMKRSAFA
jgi:intracellular septation protein A